MMKKIFIAITVLIFVFSVETTFAQITNPPVINQCAFISASNVGRCCAANQTFNDPNQAKRCDDYQLKVLCQSSPNDPRCRAVNGPTGGTQQTGPVNGGSPGDSTGAGAGTRPQGGTVDISSCSNIEFKSALDILIWVKCIIVVAIIPLIFSLAFLLFLWGVFKFMTASDVKGKQEGQKVIWWGMLGLFVMVSVWGIIKILNTTLGIESTVPMLQTEYLKK